MTTGCLVMAYGTPERESDLLAYYTDIRRGRPPSDEQLADLRRRYDAIGGLSPLAETTRAQAKALRDELGEGWTVELGMKHAAPTIEAAAGALAHQRVDSVVGVVLAPHTSVLSTGQYHERAAAALAGDGIGYRAVGRYGDDPELIALLASRVRDAVERLGDRDEVELIVTAHSLPARVETLDEPSYPAQLSETAALLAGAAGRPRHRIAWQSAGRTPEPWLGPDLLAVLRGEAGDPLPGGVVVCPAGFTSDHLEVLYDIDIEAFSAARDAGIRLERTASLNDDPAFARLLARLVAAA